MIDKRAIEAKIASWSKSPEGKKRMQEQVDEYRSSGVEHTAGGTRLLTLKEMKRAGEALVEKLRAHAVASDLPQSVLDHFNSLECGPVVKHGDGSFDMEIRFKDDLSRKSLEPSRYGGVNNIVALFNSGYPSDPSRRKAIKYVGGYWHGSFVWAKPYREGLQFMQAAVEEFNTGYGAERGITAELADTYTSDPV